MSENNDERESVTRMTNGPLELTEKWDYYFSTFPLQVFSELLWGNYQSTLQNRAIQRNKTITELLHRRAVYWVH